MHSTAGDTIDRYQIFVQFLELIAGAGAAANHTGVKPADFTEEMMVSLPMDNYEDLKVTEVGRERLGNAIEGVR